MQAISLSPSFSSYSNCKIAEIAERIVNESDSNDFPDFENRKNSADEEFEFSIVTTDSDLQLPNSAEGILKNGKIRPAYPVFNRDLLLEHLNFHGGNEEKNGVRNSVSPKIRLPLKKLFLEERETTLTTSSSSSSESDDLDGLTAESYCAWPPKSAAEDLRCEKKRRSGGGNSKRCILKDFLRRSNSDGIKTNFIVQFQSNSGRKKEIKKKVTETSAELGIVKSAAAAAAAPPLLNWNGGDKPRSFTLTHRQNLAELFAV